MSMNISIKGVREIFIPSINRTDTQDISFDCWQTPTKISYEILESSHPIEAYKQWVLSRSKPELIEHFYDYDTEIEYILTDISLSEYMSKNPGRIHYEPYDTGYEYNKALDDWITEMESEGYKITLEVW